MRCPSSAATVFSRSPSLSSLSAVTVSTDRPLLHPGGLPVTAIAPIWVQYLLTCKPNLPEIVKKSLFLLGSFTKSKLSPSKIYFKMFYLFIYLLNRTTITEEDNRKRICFRSKQKIFNYCSGFEQVMILLKGKKTNHWPTTCVNINLLYYL